MAEVLVLAGRRKPRATAALLTVARRLGRPAAVLGGTADRPSIDLLGRFGAATIYSVVAPEVDEHPVAARVEMLVRLAGLRRPAAIVIASGRDGLEIAGRVAVRLDSGVLSDVIDVTAGPDGPIATQSVQGGAYLVESSVARGVPILVVRTEHVTLAPAPVEPEIRALRVPFSDRVRAVHSRAQTRDLSTAAVIVAGGRGVGSEQGFELVRRLAAALDGVAAGSHAAAEQGWCPREAQVDQVGTIVHPSLYLALGISGSLRHRCGMHGAGTIVAIDRDPDAPIFQLSDLGAVGDVHEVVPELLAEIERRRAQPVIFTEE
ncbi:electron transfer flavoprotein subunit alpha/FixB family protein [Actinoplanes sp. KI2]|uniref:electron transfer flavoprotein subunit alpha/FixB family protein n=1 Tax=Actinoplanes sp. KI2 TaxID=2983315 RepID=UPI0021D5F825|nr:electron transfer flavoprotein subunit alpha/FixB family protein [Actinoplanes sp. KI2]MCU7724933.1 electron transfer flavoprotein subunit alpha/FixB family protein [Actinoplanes sp. KI2]